MGTSYYDDDITDHAVECYRRLISRRGEIFNQPNRLDTYRIGNEVTIGSGDIEFARYQITCDHRGCESVRYVVLSKRKPLTRGGSR